MLVQFTVEKDDSIWICDTLHLQWGRISAPHSDPNSVVLENGKLVPQGFGIYALEGRLPQNEPGIATIGVYTVALGTAIKIFLRANVQIKDFILPVPITQVLYQILPTDPKQIEQAFQSVQEVNKQDTNDADDTNRSTDSDSNSGGNSVGDPGPQGADQSEQPDNRTA